MEQILEFIQNHWLLSLAGAAVLAVIIFEEIKGKVTGLSRLTVQDASLLLNREEVVIIDLRSTKDFSQGHILKSMNIPLNEFDQHLERIKPLKNQAVILVNSNDSMTSSIASKLHKNDFTRIYVLAGGINAWKEAKLPLNKN